MKKSNILIVDDYKENIAALSGLIEADDIAIHSATNADEALLLLTQMDFALALLDVQMPGISGFELARLIRGVKKFKHLPIIFVTAQHEQSNIVLEGYGTGAVDLLFKPLDTFVVRNKVRVFVELSQQRLLLQEQVRELERLRLQAEAANIAKSQFLANMSHEIRTPLNAVMGFAELIAHGFDTEKERQASVDAVKRNGNLLLRLIDDILDLSRIEANKLDLERVQFDLGELFADVSATLSFKARDKGVTLDFSWPREALPPFMADPTRIKQVLLNVIGNAIKFTERGTVKVTANVSTADLIRNKKQIHRVTVTVADDGIGLTAEQAERLFRPFGQGDPSTRRQFGGSGLGLVISREIVRAMGGDLQLLHSTPGKGSVFEIHFLVEQSLLEPSTAEQFAADGAVIKFKKDGHGDIATVAFKGRKILAVDDSVDNLTLIQYFLRASGAMITYAESGQQAIDQVRKQNFDLILMDVQMPGMDGHEATEEIRRLGITTPIVAFTAHAIRSEHERCLKAGCDAVLTKPITHSTLLDGISRFLPPPAPQRETTREHSPDAT